MNRIPQGSFALTLTVLVGLAACQPSPTPAVQPTSSRRMAPALGPTSTATRAVNPAGTAITPTASLVPVPTPSNRDWQRGPSDAPITLLAYMDYQCTPCNTAARALIATYHRHPSQVREIYRPFPLSNVEDKADLASAAAEAAGRQGKFWAMHDLLVDRFDDWRNLAPEDFTSWLSQRAQDIGLDPDAFRKALADPGVKNQVAQRYAEARASGVPGAPFVLLNGRPFMLAADESQLEAAVRLGILGSQQISHSPQMALSPGTDYVAILRTNLGQIEFQLYADTAPLAVNSFIYLAQDGWYDGTGAYQVVPGQWVGLGDPTGTGLGDAGYHYELETDSSRHFDRPGTVGVIPAGPGLNGSRFFVSLIPLPEYDETHTVLGRISQGLDILESLQGRSPLDDLLTAPELTIESIEIETR